MRELQTRCFSSCSILCKPTTLRHQKGTRRGVTCTSSTHDQIFHNIWTPSTYISAIHWNMRTTLEIFWPPFKWTGGPNISKYLNQGGHFRGANLSWRSVGQESKAVCWFRMYSSWHVPACTYTFSLTFLPKHLTPSFPPPSFLLHFPPDDNMLQESGIYTGQLMILEVKNADRM